MVRPDVAVNGGTATCRQRPHPRRCDTCPAMAWPYGGASPAAMADFAAAAAARCPHDHPGGPVAWDPSDTEN